jgi:hypothetical protein
MTTALVTASVARGECSARSFLLAGKRRGSSTIDEEAGVLAHEELTEVIGAAVSGGLGTTSLRQGDLGPSTP